MKEVIKNSSHRDLKSRCEEFQILMGFKINLYLNQLAPGTVVYCAKLQKHWSRKYSLIVVFIRQLIKAFFVLFFAMFLRYRSLHGWYAYLSVSFAIIQGH